MPRHRGQAVGGVSPYGAVSPVGYTDSTFVYLVRGTADKKTYTRQTVVTGLSDGVNIEIKKGLSLKDRVRGPQIIADDNKEE